MRLTAYKSAIALIVILAVGTARAFDATPLLSFYQTAAASSPLWPNLGAHYLCNDSNANTTVTDTTGNYNGTASQNTALSSVAGKINTAFYGTTGNNRFTIGDNFDISSNIAISFVWWVKLNSSPPSSQEFIHKGTGGNPQFWANPREGTTGGKFILVVYKPPDLKDLWSDSNVTADGSTWVHEAVTRTSSGVYSLYINGTKQSKSLTNTWDLSNAGGMYFGAAPDGGVPTLGAFDDVRIYNRALTDAEITAMYNAGTGTEQE